MVAQQDGKHTFVYIQYFSTLGIFLRGTTSHQVVYNDCFSSGITAGKPFVFIGLLMNDVHRFNIL